MEDTGYTIKKRNPLQLFLHLRMIPWLRSHRFILVVFLGALTLILGYIGFARSYTILGEQKTPLDNIYQAVQLFTLASGSKITPEVWELEIARFTGLATMSSTFIILLIHVFFQQYHLFSLRFTKDHAIICGLGLLGPILARRFFDLGYDVIVIEKDEKKEEVHWCRDNGAIVLIGDATNPEILKTARVDKARYLISVLGDDRLNADVAAEAHRQVLERKGGPLTCLIHIVDPSLCSLLKNREMECAVGNTFRLEYFNVYQSAGESLIRRNPPFPSGEQHPPTTHVLVIGVGRMGESVIVHAARKWYDTYRDAGKKMRITMIDIDASTKLERLQFQYPALTRYCDITSFNMSVKSPEFLRGDFLNKSINSGGITFTYICLGDESLGISTAMILNHHFNDKAIPIFVRSDTDKGLSRLIEHTVSQSNATMNIRTFPIIHQNATMEIIFNTMHEILAKAIHEEYLEMQKKAGIALQSTPAMVPWNQLSEEFKESNRSQADSIIEKLKLKHYTLAPLTDWDEPLGTFSDQEVEFLAEKEHERYVNERKAKGWSYGSERDNEKKRTPTLVPWDQLPENEKEKDRNSIRVLPSILKRVNLKIERISTT